MINYFTICFKAPCQGLVSSIAGKFGHDIDNVASLFDHVHTYFLCAHDSELCLSYIQFPSTREVLVLLLAKGNQCEKNYQGDDSVKLVHFDSPCFSGLCPSLGWAVKPLTDPKWN